MHKYKDIHHGKTAIVLGKGPSLDLYKPEPNSVVFGVNDVSDKVECDYIVTTDGYDRIGPAREKRFIALPYNTKGGKCFDLEDGDEWFLHINDYNCTAPAAMQTKAMICVSHWLFTASSSVQPAIHLAWFMGCDKLKLYGIDGGGGYAPGFKSGPKCPDMMYRHALRATERICRLCFGNRVQRLTLHNN